MSRLVVQVVASQVTRREEVRATAIVEFGPGRPVRFGGGDGLVSDVLKLERPLPLSALVRHVLSRYGLEPTAETAGDAGDAQEVLMPEGRETLHA